MQVILGKSTTFPRVHHVGTRAAFPREQAAKILEEAAEVFVAWQGYDECLKEKENGNLLNAWAFELYRNDLLNECADLITACSNMICGAGYRIIGENVSVDRQFEFGLTKEVMRGVLLRAALIQQFDSTCLIEVECLIAFVCAIIAHLGVTDFRPYMQECEQRNRERGRYE